MHIDTIKEIAMNVFYVYNKDTISYTAIIRNNQMRKKHGPKTKNLKTQ